jgi:hypothetical protein
MGRSIADTLCGLRDKPRCHATATAFTPRDTVVGVLLSRSNVCVFSALG